MSLRYIREVVVASRDVAAAARFHQRAFGFETLAGDGASGNVQLGVPGAPGGRLRLVPAPPGDTAEQAPEVWDLGPRLLGIYSHDLDRTASAMAGAGGAPRKPVTYPYGTASLSELVGRGTDGVWWTVPLAVQGAHRPSAAYAAEPDRLHSELHSVVLVVDDHDAAVAFFEAAGLTTAFDGTMSGPPFDELVGMPEEASLRLAFLVGPSQEAARMEIMSFAGVPTRDRSTDETGIQRLVFAADEPPATYDALVAAGAEPVAPDVVRGPVGVEIQVTEA
jgi:hypothetical protein